MTLNIFAMVRAIFFVMRKVGLSETYAWAVTLAGMFNGAFIGGAFYPMAQIGALALWNVYFNCIKPFDRFHLRIKRGYADHIPEGFEAMRGTTFKDELREAQKLWPGNDKEAVSTAVFRILAGDDELI